MSIGNLKDSGNQGNNFPWQLKMLFGQQCACDELAAINANTDDVEFLLTSILTTLQASTEYEAKFVVDTCNGDTVYLEVRVWNPDTSTWGPITYYLPGSDTPVIPPGAATPGCLIYTDPSAVLALILGAIQAGNLILTDIETNTGDTVTELQSILALYSAGPQACADSFSVTLCTEQGTSLSNIETNTTGLATEVTLLDVKTSVQLIDDCVGTDNTAAPAKSFVVAGVTSAGVQQTIEVNTSGQVAIQDGGNSITVDGTVDLGATTLTALENITVQNPGGASAVNIQDGGNSITVDANNLDIRDLVFATDKVDVSNSTVALDSATLNALESITVQNGAGGSAVNIQDGGNTITVDSNAAVRTPTILRTTANSSVAAGAYSASFASVGTVDATVGGVTLKVGETINFDAGGINNTLASIAYDASAAGAELLIITIV